MIRRLITAFILLAILVAGLLIPHLTWVLILFMIGMSIGCVQEIRHMFRSKGIQIRKRIALIGVTAMIIEGAFSGTANGALVFGLFMCGTFAIRLRGPVEGAFSDITATVGTVAYIGIPTSVLAWLFATGPGAHQWLSFALAVTFMTDTCALLVGTALGHHKLIPKVSPGKTLEGSIGGFAGAMVAVVATKLVFPESWAHVSWIEMGLFGALFSVVTQLGDLVESLIKRDAGVKDSGSSLTGHGGFLDMLDAVLYSAVPLGVYLKLLHPEIFLSPT